jgi:putative DNA methylase
MFSNNNFHPKSTLVESSVFTGIARGDFAACAQKLLEAIGWCNAPWEIATFDGEGHSDKVLVRNLLFGSKTALIIHPSRCSPTV